MKTMSTGRRGWKPGTLLLAAGIGLAALPIDPVGAAATTERIVTDRHAGLAVYGYDPVAYFTDAKPRVGRAAIEYDFSGVTWRFANDGNRAAFADRPDVYMPRFGGYDPISLARGVASPGHPQFWIVDEERLYLFYSAEDRDVFAADPQAAVAAAEARWPEVERVLIR